jgi:hypothetical protein
MTKQSDHYELKYEYHDSIIENMEIIDNMFVLYIDLYPILYKDEPKIKITFNIIDSNIVKCKKWLNKLMVEFDENDNYLGERIDGIKISKRDGSFYNCLIECNNYETIKFKSDLIIENKIGIKKEFG